MKSIQKANRANQKQNQANKSNQQARYACFQHQLATLANNNKRRQKN